MKATKLAKLIPLILCLLHPTAALAEYYISAEYSYYAVDTKETIEKILPLPAGGYADYFHGGDVFFGYNFRKPFSIEMGMYVSESRRESHVFDSGTATSNTSLDATRI